MTGSCQTFKAFLVGLLVVWGVASLVIIAVWMSQPETTSVAPCGERLQELTEKLEGAKVVWGQNKVALEEMVEELRENQTRQQEKIQTLVESLALSRRSLEACHQEQVVLNGNISLLEQRVEQQKETAANLTALVSLQREDIETLQQNVTQASHRTASCLSLNMAAESQAMAAQSQTKACDSSKEYLERQLSRCKEHPSSQQTTGSTSPYSSSSSLAVVLTLLPTCGGLHLLLHLLSCYSSPMM
ncbi:hypothetical protein NHX12_033408 [Muraenolepis orangiensis]|uniref:Uncharacterized protein n=1 Tax=Muraenolepis orangiensis TaxID=630683 RepID=A0A9Q0E2K2_9TELE|nr:hypothetical protein NHX12_033408 [Muraenolepis orangiensis]